MIKIGNSNIVGVSLGNTQFSKLYKGNDLYWSKKATDISDFIIERGNEVSGDIVMWDRENQQKIIVSLDKIKKFPKDNYVPIGIVAIPSSQNVYGDGSCSMMSLKKMTTYDPDNGCLDYLGNLSTGVSGDYLDNPIYGYNGDTLGTTVTTSSAAQNLFNQDAVNAKIIASSPGYDWKTSETITNSTSKGNYPAGFCCWRYHTEGTKQGDWYLPSIGELYNFVSVLPYSNLFNILDNLNSLGYETKNYFQKRNVITCSESRYDQCWYIVFNSSISPNIYNKSVGLSTIMAFCKF